MTEPGIQFEGRLKAIGATSTKDGNWTKVEFQVHPNDDVSAMLRAGLNSRWLVVVVQLDDQDQPITPEKPKGGELARRAGILCGDQRFQIWIAGDDERACEENATHHLRRICFVESRAELDHDSQAAKRFLALETDFRQAHGMMAERYP